MKNWKSLKKEILFETRYFKLIAEECETFKGLKMPRYYTFDFPDWVQVYAQTAANEVVLVKQYRYPGRDWFYELPGGTTNADRKEEPLTAAQRELREETGYTSSDWSKVGEHYPNPALMNNKCHVFLAKNCIKTHPTELDPFEELSTELVAHDKIEKLFIGENKCHSLMLASLYLLKRV